MWFSSFFTHTLLKAFIAFYYTLFSIAVNHSSVVSFFIQALSFTFPIVYQIKISHYKILIFSSRVEYFFIATLSEIPYFFSEHILALYKNANFWFPLFYFEIWHRSKSKLRVDIFSSFASRTQFQFCRHSICFCFTIARALSFCRCLLANTW